MALPDVPLPSRVADRKYYLPAFDLVATVPSQEQAEALECGMLSLLQYRGNPVAGFDAASGCPEGGDPFEYGSQCPVALATRLQLFASVALGNPSADPDALTKVGAEAGLEAWETAYVAAAALFLRHDFEGCVAACRVNLQRTPLDVFSVRLLLIAGYFGEDMESLCDGFGAIVGDYEAAIAAQAAAGGAPKHALHLALPSLTAWAAFGLEETRRDVERAEALARRAIDLTHALNKRYFPSGNPDTDAPSRRGALAAVSKTHGFLCVFGVHVVVHCFETRGDPAGGLAYLKAEDPALWQPSAHLAGHVWWHYALFELECGDVTGALATYEARLGDPVVGDPFALSDAAALVVRVWQWASWFRAVGGTGGPVAASAPWAALSPADEKAAAQALLQLDEHWSTHGDEKFADFPFFVAHKHLVRAAASTVAGEHLDRFAVWPATTRLSLKRSSDVSAVTNGPARRHELIRRLKSGSVAVREARGDKKAGLAAVTSALEAWLAVADALAPAKPPSPATRVVAACAPMGGSVAQQGLLSVGLLMLWLASDDRAEAFFALKALAVQQPKAPLIQAMLAAASAASSGGSRL